MKKIFLSTIVLSLICSCGHVHHDEEVHNEEHHDHAGEIVLSAEMAQQAGVKVKTVRRSEFCETIRTSGTILAAQGEEHVLVANVAGVVALGQKVSEGMKVKAGSELFVLSSKNLESGSAAQKAKINFETAQNDYERALKLLDEQIVSKKEFNAIKQNYETAKLAFEALHESSNGKGVAVKSPIDGYIKACMVNEGDYVAVGQPLAPVTKVQRLRIKADVPGRYVSKLQSIRSVNFKTVYDDRVYSLDEMNGKLLAYGKTFEDGSNFIPVTFEFDNIGNVVPGCYVDAYLQGIRKSNVLVLPKTAITEEQGLYFVYLQMDETCYTKKEVKTGSTNGNEIEILSGIADGDKVVYEGALQVKLASVAKSIPGHTHSH